MPLALEKPTRAGRLTEQERRREVRRTSAQRNASGAVLPKPEVWQNAKYRDTARKRHDCGIKGRAGHVCGPRVKGKAVRQFAHAEPAGRGLKSSDYYGVILCAEAHLEQTRMNWTEFQRKYGFDREAEARRIFEASPWFGKVDVEWS